MIAKCLDTLVGGYSQRITPECELNWIRQVMANPSDYRCAIIVNGVYVGNIYLTDINNGTATYHIFIGDKTYWGEGSGQASLTANHTIWLFATSVAHYLSPCAESKYKGPLFISITWFY